jgi:hypothetical protein
VLAGGDDRGDDDANILPPPVGNGRLRIPDGISRQYEIPQKWIRLTVDVPPLELLMPCDPEVWQAETERYRLTLLGVISRTFETWIASPEGQRNAWRKIRPPSEAFWDAAGWEAFLVRARAAAPSRQDLVPQFNIQLLVQALRDPIGPDEHSVRFALENLQEDDASKECGLFGVAVSVDLPVSALGSMRLERVRRSYHLAGFTTMPGIGVNGGVVDLGSSDNRRTLRTTWMPRYVLPRIQPTQIGGVPTAFSTLSETAFSVASLTSLTSEMKAWIKEVQTNTLLFAAGEEGNQADEVAQEARFQADLVAWGLESDRIGRGIKLLSDSQSAWRADSNSMASAPYRAWLLLNRTFHAANPPKEGEPPPGWRLFQLAFVLTHIPTFASRIPDFATAFDPHFDEDSASLLYMSTGGGKTEAFFGTLVFALFLDRLRGKRRGVTAMMHYPLRLLTVQQAQRLARLVAHAELVRRAELVEGSAFEIGFWVGGSNTPNSTERAVGEIAEPLRCIPTWNEPRGRDEEKLLTGSAPLDRQYQAANLAWNKLPECPFCRHAAGTALRLFPDKHHRLGILCLNRLCAWNVAHAPPTPEPLPFLLVDSDIYRRAPSILLGTIDKLALLGQSTNTVDKIAGMFGLARWVEGGSDGLLQMPSGAPTSQPPPVGVQRVAPAYSDGVELFFDPFPSLIVQDEMHLLEESLGTFGGIFETTLFAWLQELSTVLDDRVCRVPGAPKRPRLPHVIGATATAADVTKHARALYQKSVVQFPHPGPALHGGFYTRMARFSPGSRHEQNRRSSQSTPRGREAAAPWGRVYASLMTNGRLHTVTTLAVLATHAATITRWQRDLASSDISRQSRASIEIEQCVSDAPWSLERRTAISNARAQGRFDRLAALVDLHRIELTYVTNKKGGDQILAALEGEVREAHAKMGHEYELTQYEMKLISGGVDIAGIQEVIRAAQRPFDPMTEDISTALRGIVATSAISHGVDVDTFNAMAFAGMPADIAEYIQASSRVGRTHVGFSLLVPTPQTRRDRFVLEVHESFHRLLERMISPPAVERWADRAIERTIPSLVQTWVAGVHQQKRFVSASIANKSRAAVPVTVEAVDQILRDPSAFNECVAFVAAAVGISAPTGGPSNPTYYSDLVRSGVSKIRNTISGGEFVGRLMDFWSNPLTGLQRPMMSLRDVDASGQIRASNRTHRNQQVTSDQIGDAMTVVRNRGGGRRRRNASSELDQEV